MGIPAGRVRLMACCACPARIAHACGSMLALACRQPSPCCPAHMLAGQPLLPCCSGRLPALHGIARLANQTSFTCSCCRGHLATLQPGRVQGGADAGNGLEHRGGGVCHGLPAARLQGAQHEGIHWVLWLDACCALGQVSDAQWMRPRPSCGAATRCNVTELPLPPLLRPHRVAVPGQFATAFSSDPATATLSYPPQIADLHMVGG